MGTPDFAARILEALLESQDSQIVAVYTRPDKKSGRGLKTTFSEVKKLALQYNLPLYQPSTLRSEEAINELKNLKPEYLVVAAYGQILPQAVLDIPVIAPINVHASLLPALRGAAPIQRAIIENTAPDAKTGISIMKMVAELDAGPVYAQKELSIGRMDYTELEGCLSEVGASLLPGVLADIEAHGLEPVPQDTTKVTYAPKLEKADGQINWTKTAEEVDALVRGVTPWPGAQSEFTLSDFQKSIPVTILKGSPGSRCAEKPGRIMRHRKGIAVACADAWYEVAILRPQGRKPMSASDFANGQIKVRNGLCGQASMTVC